MSAQNTDKLRRGFFGSSTTLSASIGDTDTTIPVSSTTGWPTDTAIDITIDRVDANGNKTPTKRETITVVVSGINGINALRGVEGTAQPHSAGAIVEITFTAATHNDQVTWGLKNHDQQGNHQSLTDTNGNTILSLLPTASAVNNLQVGNATTGNAPSLNATGTDANIPINLIPKGTGAVEANGNNVWYYLGYAQTKTAVTTTATSAATATAISALSVTATIPTGCKAVKITAYCPALANNAGVNTFFSIWQGTVGSGTQLQFADQVINVAGEAVPVTPIAVIQNPTAGSVTYNIGIYNGSASTSTANAFSSAPMFILVEAC
jgi:hypothetical protein